MDRISVPVLPCASRESITFLDIIKKKSVMNCVVPSLYSCDRSLCQSEVKHVAIDFDHIYRGVIITHPIKSLCIRTNAITEGLIITTLTGKVIQTLIIVDPESNIPSLIIRPTVILSVGQIGLESDSHLEKTWGGLSLHYRDTLQAPPFSYSSVLRYHWGPAISPHDYPHRSLLVVA